MLNPPRSMEKVRLEQFSKFCLVGGSGVVVDMTLLHFLAHPEWGSLNVMLAKTLAAETALLNNFLWNEFWTFRRFGQGQAPSGRLHRLVRFHAICGFGIFAAVLLLHLFHIRLAINLYIANGLVILLVTLWNFWMNAAFNWRCSKHTCEGK
jgi:dolichol-phosphate mannosyltransferase